MATNPKVKRRSQLTVIIIVLAALIGVLSINTDPATAVRTEKPIASTLTQAGSGLESSDDDATGFYAGTLRAAMRGGILTVGAIVGATAGCFLLVPALGSELFPEVDAGTFEVRIKTIPGTRLEKTEERVAAIEEGST